MIDSPENGTTEFIMTHVPSQTIIGKIGIWQSSEIGFLISRAYWRQGLVSEALQAVIPYSFDEKGYERITADVDPRNDASIKILEKHGFVMTGRREKTFKIGGLWVDSVDLVLERTKWREMRRGK